MPSACQHMVGLLTDGVKSRGFDLGIKVPSGSDSLGFSVLSESTFVKCLSRVPGPS